MAGKLQFNLKGLLALTFFVACVFGLTRVLENQGGFAITIPLAAIPFALLVEWMFDRRPESDETLTRRQFATRVALILGLSAWLSSESLQPLTLLAIDPSSGTISFLGALMKSLRIPDSLSYGIRMICFVAFNGYVARVADPQPAPLRIPILLTYVTVCYGLWLVLHLLPEVQVPLSSLHARLGIGVLIGAWILWVLVRKRAPLYTLFIWGVMFQSWLLYGAFPVRNIK